MTKLTIYHNPRCSKSRQTLQLIEQHGIEPTIKTYLDTPPSASELKRLLKQLNLKAHDLIRNKETDYKTLGLSKDDSEKSLIDAMVQYPKLIERPIVTDGTRAVLGRPPENVLELID